MFPLDPPRLPLFLLLLSFLSRLCFPRLLMLFFVVISSAGGRISDFLIDFLSESRRGKIGEFRLGITIQRRGEKVIVLPQILLQQDSFILARVESISEEVKTFLHALVGRFNVIHSKTRHHHKMTQSRRSCEGRKARSRSCFRCSRGLLPPSLHTCQMTACDEKGLQPP